MSDADSYAYTGAQDAGTTVSEYNTRQFQVEQTNAQQRIKTPVRVVRAPYDADGNDIAPGTPGPIGYIDVHPLVNQVDGDGNATPHGIVYRIPYHRYQGGTGAIISDPAVGDIGDYVVDDRDTSVVYSTSDQGNPGSGLKSSLSNGVYHGQTRATAPNQYITFLADGILWCDKDGNSIKTDASGVVITVASGNHVVTVSNGTISISASGGITIHSDASIALTAPPNTITANGNPLG